MLSIKALVLCLVLTNSLHAAPKKLWLLSVGTMIAANALDVHSSTGLQEVNPLLRNSRGGFSMRRGIALKIGLAGGLILVEKLTRRPFIPLNFVVAGTTGIVAGRNYRLKAPR
jgi:hypothetical protein